MFYLRTTPHWIDPEKAKRLAADLTREDYITGEGWRFEVEHDERSRFAQVRVYDETGEHVGYL